MSRNLDSWLHNNEWEFLMNFAKNARGDMVELGTYRGGTALGICENMPKQHNFYTIDNYSDGDFFHLEDYNPVVVYRKLKEIKNNSYVIVGDSTETGVYWNRSIWAVFIDACHETKNVLKDFLAWGDKAKYVLFHDYHKDHPGVIDAVNFIIDKRIYGAKLIEIEHCLAVLELNRGS